MLWSSDDLDGLGMGVSVDGLSGDVYVAGFTSSDEGVDTVVVHKVRAMTIFEAVPNRRGFYSAIHSRYACMTLPGTLEMVISCPFRTRSYRGKSLFYEQSPSRVPGSIHVS